MICLVSAFSARPLHRFDGFRDAFDAILMPRVRASLHLAVPVALPTTSSFALLSSRILRRDGCKCCLRRLTRV